MELSTIKYSDFTKLAKVLWLKGKEDVDKNIRGSGLVKEMPIPNNSGNTREFSEIDLEEFATEKDEGDQADRANVQQGYSATMTNKRIAKNIGISYEMRTQNKYPTVVSKLTNLGALPENRMELDLTHRLTFATSTSYTNLVGDSVDIAVGDGKALAASDHTLKGSSTTFRNILANNPQLSKGALEAAERLVSEQTYNQFGEKKAMSFDIIFTSDDPVAINAARELLQSTAKPSAPNEGVSNVYRGKYKHVILPYLATDKNGAADTSKRHYWGIASSTHTTFYLGIWEEPHMKEDGSEDMQTDDWEFGTRAGYGICIPSANWVKMSKGDGSA